MAPQSLYRAGAREGGKKGTTLRKNLEKSSLGRLPPSEAWENFPDLTWDGRESLWHSGNTYLLTGYVPTTPLCTPPTRSPSSDHVIREASASLVNNALLSGRHTAGLLLRYNTAWLWWESLLLLRNFSFQSKLLRAFNDTSHTPKYPEKPMSMAVWRPQCDSHRYTGFRNDLSGEFQGPASTCVSAAQPLVNDLRCQASVNFIRENSGGKKKQTYLQG